MYNYFTDEDTVDDADDDDGRGRKYTCDGENPRDGKMHSTADALMCRRAVENQPSVPNGTLTEDPGEKNFPSSPLTKHIRDVALDSNKTV